MNKARYYVFILLFAFCFSTAISYSEPTDDYDKACKLIQNKWINSSCAIGISKEIKDPLSILSKMYKECDNPDTKTKIEFLIGECHFHGENISQTKDQDTAVDYYQKSAKKGHTYSKYMLAQMVINNKTSIISKKEAYDYLKEAAEGGYKEALKEIIILYTKGNDYIQKDEKKAEYFVKKYLDQLDNVLEKEIELLTYYSIAGKKELFESQREKIVKSVLQHNISGINTKQTESLLGYICIPHFNFLYAINDDFYKEFAKGNDEEAISLLSKDIELKTYLDYTKPILDKIKTRNNNFNESDWQILHSLVGEKKDIWLNAINKFYKTHKESEQVFNKVIDYYNTLIQNNNSETDLEEYKATLAKIKSSQKGVLNLDKQVQMIIFDNPINFSCFMIVNKLSDSSISNDEKKKMIQTFIIISSSSLSYALSDNTRNNMIEAYNIIKENYPKDEYKKLRNESKKIIPELDLAPKK